MIHAARSHLPQPSGRTTHMRPVNETQREFKDLCDHGGGLKGGPMKAKVLDLLRRSGQALNALAYTEAKEHFDAHPDANPWHVCFALGLIWGHLAQMDTGFTAHVVNVLSDWNDHDLNAAGTYHNERGSEPIIKSLTGAHILFGKVTLPLPLPSTLDRLGTAQQRWLSPVLSAARPPYIGSWNATAMFMSALFAQPGLAKTQTAPTPILPPGGPIFTGLRMLHDVHVLSRPPAGSELDDEAFEPGALYENNALLAELLTGLSDWCLIDVHSGVYMLGTRDPRSDTWI